MRKQKISSVKHYSGMIVDSNAPGTHWEMSTCDKVN